MPVQPSSCIERQRGLASLELVAVLPILLLFVYLCIFFVEAALLRGFTLVEVRNAAWREATAGGGCFALPRARHRGQFLYASCNSTPASARALLEQFGTQRWERRFAQRIERDGSLPPRIEARAMALKTFGRPDAPGRHWFTLPITERYTVDADARWTRTALPLGYDADLQQQLGSRRLYPGLFPGGRR